MKVRALKSFASSIVNMDEGDVKEVELDEPTFEYWTSNGFVEEVIEDPDPGAVTT